MNRSTPAFPDEIFVVVAFRDVSDSQQSARDYCVCYHSDPELAESHASTAGELSLRAQAYEPPPAPPGGRTTDEYAALVNAAVPGLSVMDPRWSRGNEVATSYRVEPVLRWFSPARQVDASSPVVPSADELAHSYWEDIAAEDRHKTRTLEDLDATSPAASSPTATEADMDRLVAFLGAASAPRLGEGMPPLWTSRMPRVAELMRDEVLRSRGPGGCRSVAEGPDIGSPVVIRALKDAASAIDALLARASAQARARLSDPRVGSPTLGERAGRAVSSDRRTRLELVSRVEHSLLAAAVAIGLEAMEQRRPGLLSAEARAELEDYARACGGTGGDPELGDAIDAMLAVIDGGSAS